jgi:hypothetical protein
MLSLNHKAVLQFLIQGIIAISMAACTLNERTATRERRDAEKSKIIVNNRMTAIELADAGEQLVTPYSFMLADKTFSMALEKDPTQQKALFYKEFLKQFMVFKGIMARLKPLLVKGQSLDAYNTSIRNLPNTPIKAFLLNGQPDIHDEPSAQDFIAEYVLAINSFREFLIKNPELNFVINLNPYLYEEKIQEEWGKSCKVIKTSEQSFQVECNASEVATKKVNSADLLVLRQIAAAQILSFSFYAAYSLEGVTEIKKIANFEELPYSEQVRIIKSHPQLGTLRNAQIMHLWVDIAQDFGAGLKRAQEIQNELCPNGFIQRPGFLFTNGLCLPNDEKSVNERGQILAVIGQALQGTIPLDGLKADGSEYHTIMDPLAIAKKPIADLKTLIPDQERKCDQTIALPDPTLGGVFPRGDASDFINNGACVK